VQTADSILAKFDELIANLEADSARDKREVQEIREAERAAAIAEPESDVILEVTGLTKHFGETIAVAGIDLTVVAGTIFGIVGPNGAGKTTTLSMITGLLRPGEGTVIVHGADVWANPAAAKRQMGVLPDRLRLFDRLTGQQFLYYAGVLRGLPQDTVRERMAQLAETFRLDDALGRLVADYSAGLL
jgi:ABC-2 type transport system ATP-binding protein